MTLDMSVRLSSIEAPLGKIACELNIKCQHIHFAGKPMAKSGPNAGRIATHHYIVMFSTRVADDEAVVPWILKSLAEIDAAPRLVDGLRSGVIEGTMWIARMYSENKIDMPALSSEIIENLKSRHFDIVLENYSDFDDGGNPIKLII